MAELVLAGKDYFTEEEAAAYCCVSESQFRAKRAEYGLQGFTFMGKRLYRKADLQGALDNAWQRSPIAAAVHGESGRKRPRRVLALDRKQEQLRVRGNQDGKQDDGGASRVVDLVQRTDPA